MTTDPKKYAELRKKVEFQVACEEKAFRIIERLIENPISHDFLQDALHFITPSHYSDIVEERAVSKLCGYPLCPKSLDKVLKQKYMISTKTNKVYDIEERKNFCSARCYQASQHVEKQISSSPVWTRNSQPKKKYTFLSLDTHKGKVGEEVFLSMADELREEIKAIDKMDTYHDKLEERKVQTDKQSGSKNQSEDDGSEVYTLDRALQEMDSGGTENNCAGGRVPKNSCQINEKSGNVINTEKKVWTQEMSGNHILSGNKQDTKSSYKVPEKESRDSNKSKHSKAKSKGPNPQTEYLMKLLDKRKSLLSKMADIQEPTSSSSEKSSSDNRMTDNMHEEEIIDNKAGSEKNTDELNNKSLPTATSAKISEVYDTHTHSKIELSIIHPTRKKYQSAESLHKNGPEENTRSEHVFSLNSHIEKDCENKSDISGSSPFVGILEVIQSWITKDSVDYLSVDNVVEGTQDEFQRRYQELVKKVDTQERDFDKLLGDECMDKQEGSFKAHVPDFEQLKKETEENYQKVNAFLGGKLTYKVKEKIVEKDTNSSPLEIVLPSVDRYNQMVIRQKIVLDRISKVLPELLSPLRLFVQDVFTELRELVATFNLTSENITFKPEEWLIVTFILLKLLCRRVHRLQHGFTTSSAQTHFTVLLNAMNFDLKSLEKKICSLLIMQRAQNKE